MAMDISEGGLRVRRDAAGHLPTQLAIYDQSDRTFRTAAIAWAYGAEVGMRFTGQAIRATPSEAERLSGRPNLKERPPFRMTVSSLKAR